MSCVNYLFVKLRFLVLRSLYFLIFRSQGWCIQRSGFQIFHFMDSVLDFLVLGVGLGWTEWHSQRLYLWSEVGFGIQSSALWINLMTFHSMFWVISVSSEFVGRTQICSNTSLMPLDETWNLIKQLSVWHRLCFVLLNAVCWCNSVLVQLRRAVL